MKQFFNPLLFSGIQAYPDSSDFQSAYPRVNTYADLPDPTISAGLINIVLTTTGNPLYNQKVAGMWYSNGVVWTRLGNTPGFFSSGVFSIYDSTDNSKQAVFNVSGISTGNIRIITMPDSNVDLNNVYRAATGSNNGYLASADWTTFNSKFNLPALTAGSVLFSDGTTLVQDNANFNYSSSAYTLSLGSTSNNAILALTGSLNLYDSNGTPQFRTALSVTAASNLNIGAGFSTLSIPATSLTFSSTNNTLRNPSGTLNIALGAGGTGIEGVLFTRNANLTHTTGNGSMINIQGTFAPVTGTGTFVGINIISTYTQSGSATGNITGINYAPTINSVLGNHYFINSTAGIIKSGDITASTSTTTGSAIFAGGVGISGSLFGVGANFSTASISDTGTYKTALDISAANVLRLGNGFTSVNIASGGGNTVTFTSNNFTYNGASSYTFTLGSGANKIKLGNTSSTNLTFDAIGGGVSSGTCFLFNGASAFTYNAGDTTLVAINPTYQVSALSSNFIGLNLVPTCNINGTATGSFTCININPTITNLTGTLYGLRSQIAYASGQSRWNIFSDGTAPSYFGGGMRFAYTALSANTTLNATYRFVDVNASGGAISITLPSASTVGAGFSYSILKNDSSVNTVTIVGTINGATNYLLSTQYAKVTVVSDGTNWKIFA